MTRRSGRYGFTDISPLRLNRGSMPALAGNLRLIFIISAMFGAAQFLVPLIARVILNGGQVYPNREGFANIGAIVEDPVLSVPAWLTISTGLVGLIAAAAYLLVRGADAGVDAAYVSIVSLVCFGLLPWAIAGFDPDPSGIIYAPGEDGYPIGWHWLATPLSLVVVVLGIIDTVRANRRLGQLKAQARARVAARARGEWPLPTAEDADR